MPGFWKYLILFITMLLLQFLLFDSINVSIYVTILGYTAFFTLLPLKLKHIWFLLSGLAAGLAADLFMGTGGLNTVASLATGFLRPSVARIGLGRDAERDGEIPSPRTHPFGKWMRYAAILTGIHCLVFFMMEAFSLRNIEFTLLRTACSWGATMVVVLLTGLLFPVKTIRN